MDHIFLFFYNAVTAYLTGIGINLTDSIDINILVYVISYILGVFLFALPIYIVYKIIRSVF